MAQILQKKKSIALHMVSQTYGFQYDLLSLNPNPEWRVLESGQLYQFYLHQW